MSNSKTKHTPGPWVLDFASAESATVRTAEYPQRTVALCADDVVGHRNPENAQLIAAAPELLEALESAIEILKFSGLNIPDTYVRAIAKARGES